MSNNKIEVGSIWQGKNHEGAVEIKYVRDIILSYAYLQKPERNYDASIVNFLECFELKPNPEINIDSVWRDKKSGELVYIESLDGSIWNINFNSLDNVNEYADNTEEFLSQYEFVCDSRFDSCLALNAEVGRKDDSQKIRYSLLPVGTVNQVVEVLEFGSKKYADNNWQKVPNARTRYYDAALRHIDWWWQGEKSDSETGLHHLAHAICCLMFLIWFDGDDK